jgi:mono/diheme cytochrome c family protein
MFPRSAAILALALALAFAASLCVRASATFTAPPQGKDAPQSKPATHEHVHDESGWTIPPEAEQKKSPLTVDAKVLAQGKTIFKSKCQKCHGPGGLGDGPDADPDHQEDMDLTKARRDSKNPEGVMFFKVSNGRKSPKMTAFKKQLNEEQIWTVVAYAQSLRK